jgi:O-acetyl-ADP-ribose deacetylase (regulator of RNase III)
MPLTVTKGDITKVKNVDAIVNAANGIGVMGAGVARAIRRAAGEGFAVHVRDVAKAKRGWYSAGDVYVTDCGLLADNGIKAVLHAVTMKYPGGGTSYDVVEQCLQKVFAAVRKMGYTSVAVPGLGTGIGSLDPGIVAQSTVRIAQRFGDLDVRIIDIDEEFVSAAKTAFNPRTDEEASGQ